MRSRGSSRHACLFGSARPKLPLAASTFQSQQVFPDGSVAKPSLFQISIYVYGYQRELLVCCDVVAIRTLVL
jgi:hypothetical protein